MLVTIELSEIVLYLIITDPVVQAFLRVHGWTVMMRKRRYDKLFYKLNKVLTEYNLTEANVKV